MVDEFSYSEDERVFIHMPTGLYIEEINLFGRSPREIAEEYSVIGMTDDDVKDLKAHVNYERQQRYAQGLPIL